MLKIGFRQLRFVLTCLPQEGFTALLHACSRGHEKVVSVLLSAGASIEVQTKVRSGEESTRIKLFSFHLCSFQIGKKTPLQFACDRGAVGMVSELLAAGAQIEARDSVSELGSVSVCLNDSLSLQYPGFTPLHHACFRGHGGGDCALIFWGFN
jgi:ankyrin repeat protein